MKVHFMGRDTGIPGNTWPDSAKFNTTLDFTLDLPDSQVQCSANWTYQAISTAVWSCTDNTITFQLSPTPDGALADAQWTLTITETAAGDIRHIASKVIENNSPGTPDSYLSCMGGPPYDGIRCSLNGWAGQPGPIVLTASSP
ncbi:hypothetical protein ACEQ8H_004193 [Pleosporales sp. CAS-2024a]